MIGGRARWADQSNKGVLGADCTRRPGEAGLVGWGREPTRGGGENERLYKYQVMHLWAPNWVVGLSLV
jgi:hypothetical protein